MFADQDMQYRPAKHSAAGSFSTCSSNSSSFSSDGFNWDSSSTMDTPLHTPTRSGFDFIKLEDAYLCTPTPSSTPERHGTEPGLCKMNSMAQAMPSGFLDLTLGCSSAEMLLSSQNMMGYNNFSTYIGSNGNVFGNNHSSTSFESQSFDGPLFSPISEMVLSSAEDFVDPSQTTFMDTFDMDSSQLHAKSLQHATQYNSASADYDCSLDLGSSPPGSIKCFYMSSSCSTTPSRSLPLRQPVVELLETSAALHRVQEQTNSGKEAQPERPTRRRVKQETRQSLFSNNITVQKLAKEPCTWPGCNKKFQRREHLKRHLNIHLKVKGVTCEFCHRHFGRSDNLKTHLLIHGNPEGDHKRTSYHPEALQVVEEMNRKSVRKRMVVETNERRLIKRRSRVTPC